MRQDRLYSSWLATLMLLLIAWLAASPGGEAPSPAIAPPAVQDAVPSTNREVLAGKKIIIDPGHGGQDRSLGDFGTEGVGPTPEKVNTLEVALHLRSMLIEAGADVVMTRTYDVNPAVGTPYGHIPEGQLLARVEIARNAGGDAFVSIHNDWHPDPAISGTTSYYYHPQSRLLAENIQKGLVAARGSVDRGVHQKGFMVIRDVPMPSVLVEVGYLSNAWEAQDLADADSQRAAATGLYQGIVDYFTNS